MKQIDLYPLGYVIEAETFHIFRLNTNPGPDPGFSIGGGMDPFWGGWPPTWALFSENVCKNERIGSCRGVCTGMPP